MDKRERIPVGLRWRREVVARLDRYWHRVRLAGRNVSKQELAEELLVAELGRAEKRVPARR